ncbi:3-deoxy-manno-octulosonate cytidylyltransferase [Candidatus Steffania adelgidicola]|uniref:3-deoxy-manno-octulosonate cytidylyltransferase n=1 Tax=Candidatus Steffania adelgidicola TaxID=1076626 RepID=UPI001D022C94|nr:3-deoxy-manno-octulosonate cytidylyltransferase [Candidatus Steffania adelgidicola]UDG79626.1 3-deoxy-manno-octulosonate cytidylyltransferase [Candidatus Steffania adelgidicola]
MSFITIIPVRFASRRLPGKPLVDINGKPMLIHVIERAEASGADRVIVATDHPGVVEAVQKSGGEVYLTRFDHQSGTERLHEVIDRYGFSDDQIIVNVQGDEPFIPPQIIRQVAENLLSADAGMTTLAVPITKPEEAFNPNIVKVVLDMHGYALYFSRATIPWDREEFAHSRTHFFHTLLRHIGIYAYRVSFIRRYVSWSASPLEKVEMLEQLRVLWYGEKIHVALASVAPGMSVDTPEELAQVRLNQKMNCSY